MIINLNKLGGGGGVTPSQVEKIVDKKIVTKQDKLTAGEGVYLFDNVVSTVYPEVPNHEIWYTTTNGLTAQTTNGVGKSILNEMGLVSNTYKDGKGIMKFSKEVTSIGEQAFLECTTIKEIYIPNTITEIGRYTFAKCTSLKRIVFPDTLTNIDYGSFSGCTSLTNVTIPESVTTLGNYAFRGCSGLTSVAVPKSITAISNGLFMSCSGLTSVTIPKTVIEINNFAFAYSPAQGVFYCDENWFINLSKNSKQALYNVANWERKPIHLNTLQDKVEDLQERVNELELFKFPNATIFGQPTIQSGQISNFSNDNYLQFPFLVDFQNRAFSINFSFTTPSILDSTGQQNILDSDFGLAFALRNGKAVLVASDNGTSWTTGELISKQTLAYSTTYYFRISWAMLGDTPTLWAEGGLYKDAADITMEIEMQNTPFPKTMVIGRSYVDGGNYFHGSINLNDASLEISDKVVWQGMDDVGLATRAAVDMSNIDDKGKKVIDERIDAKINGTFQYDASTKTLTITTV